jgi:hypothetical protein
MSEFSDRPFVAGSLFGLRAFHVDRYGRLTSPSFGDHVFTPGENVSVCKRGWTKPAPPGSLTFAVHASFASWHETPQQRAEREENEARAQQPHEAGAIFCRCGFYAYTDGRNDYLKENRRDRVGGIVEGYGICTVGTRGFRAERVRLVALIEPRDAFAQPDRWERVQHNYPDVPVYATKREAIAAHPLHEAEMPTPETDPTFWTLAVSR